MNGPNVSVNATFCATLVDQWVAEGMTAAFIAPGSRSTPLALALASRSDLTIELFHDERSAAFAALGHGLATGKPAAVVCSSGTAGAHFFAAVIEADVAAVPMLVCTADRPPELWGRGAPQTIDQTNLFSSKVRAFHEPGPPDELDPRHWRPLAQQSWGSATGHTPGPVHLNLSFREPLAGVPDTISSAVDPLPVRTGGVARPETIASIVEAISATTGVIVAGRSETSPRWIIQLAEALGWPIIADHRSGCREANHPNVINRFDSLLRHRQFALPHRPQVVLRIGEIVSSKAVSQWLSSCDATVLSSRPWRRHIDPENIADISFDEAGVIEGVVANLSSGAPTSPGWLASWRRADDIAEAAVTSVIADGTVNEILVARTVVESVPVGGALVVASSMTVRDVEWFGPARSDISTYANRGANGIDGTIATATAIALTGVPTVCLIGDVALLHDATSLTALRHRSIDLTIAVTDNDGGGIFSFLPQHTLLDAERYEQLFGTPHGTDLLALAAAHGIPAHAWPGDLTPHGVRMVVAATTRGENLERHDAAHRAVADALGTAPIVPAT